MKFYIRLVLIVISSGLAILSFPLPDYHWLIWFSLVPGIIAVQRVGFWKGLILGEIFGFLFIFNSVNWFGFFGWEPRIFGSLHFGSCFALFFAFMGIFSFYFKPGQNWVRFIFPPLLWTALEWYKAQGLLSFTWGIFGFTQYNNLPLIQISSITGVWGVSFIIASINTLLAELILVLSKYKVIKDGNEKEIIQFNFSFLMQPIKIIKDLFENDKYLVVRKFIFIFAVGFVLIFLSGYLRIIFESRKITKGKPLKVGIVQPSLPQNLKWKPENLFFTMDLLARETNKLSKKGINMVIWPETAVPHRDPLSRVDLRQIIENSARLNDILLVTGLVEWDKKNSYNSAILVDSKGKVLDRYRKIHLVPFAEYMPFEFLRKYKIFNRTGSYGLGKKVTVFKTKYGDFSTLICFESYFDYLARKMVNKGAQFLMVLTNDAWYQKTNEAKCHFIMAIFRAVENRVWVIQASNTGISGIIDPLGRVKVKTELFKRTSFTGKIYKSKSRTFYTVSGNWFPFLSMVISIFIMIWLYVSKRKKV